MEGPMNKAMRARRHRHRRLAVCGLCGLLSVAALLPLLAYLGTWLDGVHAAPAQTEITNPRANAWRAVRDGVKGFTTVQGQERGVLIQNGGQNWREIRNGIVAGISPWVLALVFLAIGAFYVVKGKDRLEERPSGQTIPRWSLPERVLHWITAALFVTLAVSGLSILFGRRVLLPVFGPVGFSWYAGYAMKVHNYCGPLFLVGILLEIISWVKYNIPKRMDLLWFKTLGGMLGEGPRPHAERINGGEKAWFWLIATIGLGVCAAGLVMDFPNFGQTRETMQIANIIHASLATLFIAASFGHIYIGTIGAEGTFDGMWRGRVSAEWARQHQDLWYNEVVAAKPSHEKEG